MNSIFMTATGTDIGKTHVSCAYLAYLRKKGLKPTPVKPLMTGFSKDALDQSDAGRLLIASGRPATEAEINMICALKLEAELAPNVAARQAGVKIDYDDLLAFVNSRMLLSEGPVLVEGAGGIMSPVNDEKLHVDLVNDLAMPCFLLASNYLGAVSHTLSALEVLKARAARTLAVIITQPTADHGRPEGLAEELARWSDTPCLIAPYSADATAMESLAEEMDALIGVVSV